MLSLVLGFMLLGIVGFAAAECTDSDERNYNVLGETSLDSSDMVYEDTCELGKLKEYYCDGDEVKEEIIDCFCASSPGLDGVCIETSVCEDSENPSGPGWYQDEYIQRTITTTYMNGAGFEQTDIVIDECVENNNLVDYSCSPEDDTGTLFGTGFGDYISCPNGCSNGACLAEVEDETGDDENETETDLDENETVEDDDNPGLGQTIRNRVRAGTYISPEGAQIRVRELAQNRIQFFNGNYSVGTELGIEEETENNETTFNVNLNNGRNAEVKIMPNVASATALARLRLKVCNESRNCSIELKEVGQGNKTRLVYEARAKKTFRILGMFKNREQVQTQIDAETGEVVATNRPWWAWMASEEDEADEN